MYLGLIGALFTYVLWFRGLSSLEPTVVSTLGFLSPIAAVLLGWLLLDQHLTTTQVAAILIVFISVWLSQLASRANPIRPTTAPASILKKA